MKIKVYILKDKYSILYFTEPKILVLYNEHSYSGNNLQEAIYSGHNLANVNYEDLHNIGMYNLYEIEITANISNNIDLYNNIMNNIPEEFL